MVRSRILLSAVFAALAVTLAGCDATGVYPSAGYVSPFYAGGYYGAPYYGGGYYGGGYYGADVAEASEAARGVGNCPLRIGEGDLAACTAD